MDAGLITQYVVYKLTDDGTQLAVLNHSAMMYIITGLKPNHPYTFAVRPLGLEVNGSISKCPECRTKEAGRLSIWLPLLIRAQTSLVLASSLYSKEPRGDLIMEVTLLRR